MSSQDTMAFNYRQWELKNPREYHHVKGTGNSKTEIILPRCFHYGDFIYLRDVLFLFSNTFKEVNFEFTKVSQFKTESYTGLWGAENTSRGKAMFIEKVFRPVYGQKYYYQLTSLPITPEKYGLFHKMHFIVVGKEDKFQRVSSLADYYTKHEIQPHHYKVAITKANTAIMKYVCFICKNIYDIKDLHTFTLEGKKNHICKTCYEDIPYLDIEKVILKKV